MAGNSRYAGRTVTNKITAILLTFANGDCHSLTEIARLAALPASTAHRLASELAAAGILERCDHARYRAGLQLKAIGANAAPFPDIHQRACRVIEDLTTATMATARYGVLEGTEVASMATRGPSPPMSECFEAAVLPAHATAMGKALLAFSAPHVVEAVIAGGLERFTPYTLTTANRLRRSLGVTRLTRVAVSRRELDINSSAVAVAVFGPGGGVIAALELELPDPMSDARPLQAPLIVAARAFSRELVMRQAWRQFASAHGLMRHTSADLNGQLRLTRTVAS
jgi:DNA-binding IclR family transcriptional regulator